MARCQLPEFAVRHKGHDGRFVGVGKRSPAIDQQVGRGGWWRGNLAGSERLTKHRTTCCTTIFRNRGTCPSNPQVVRVLPGVLKRH